MVYHYEKGLYQSLIFFVNVGEMDLYSDPTKDLKAIGNQGYCMQAGAFHSDRRCLWEELLALHSYELQGGLWVLLPPQIED